jgi:hypothetical protein
MKTKILRLTLLLVLFVPMFAFSQAEDVKWDYPVKPGTKEWNELKTEKERINAVQIPDDVLDSMTTEDMVDACINFPLFGYYSAFNTPQEGFNIMLARFNIFNKVCEMDHVGNYLTKIYEDAGMSGWKKMGDKLDSEYWTLRLSYLEYFIAQKEVIYNLNPGEKIKLLKIAKTKLDQKRAHESFNSIPGIGSSLLLMSRILDSENALQGSLSEKENIRYFFETGLLNDPEVANEILRLTELYVNQ